MRVFSGTLIYATEDEPMVIAENSLIGVKDKKILFKASSRELTSLKDKYGFTEADITTLNDSEFLMPGLIDTHIHGPQYVNAGAALDLPLLEWLEKYTFPAENSFQDIMFAQHAYGKVVERVLRNGTTTAFYNATIHVEGTLALCETCERLGQRAIVGKVCMDQNAPDYYIEETAASVQKTERYIQAVLDKEFELVTPAVVPRFAISATEELMKELAAVINKYGVHVQTHLAESRPEVKWVKELFPWSKNYTDVYQKCGILTDNSSMAHCVYLSDEELALVKSHGSGVCHCPNSNCSLKSGMCDVRRLLDNGIKVGLGTDVSGGYHPSVFDAIRYTTMVSNLICADKPSNSYTPVDFKEAFRLATLGGSKVLGINKKVGTFAVGLEFDALRINPKVQNSPIDVFKRDSLTDIIQKFFYLGDDRNIVEVYVAGKQVVPLNAS